MEFEMDFVNQSNLDMVLVRGVFVCENEKRERITKLQWRDIIQQIQMMEGLSLQDQSPTKQNKTKQKNKIIFTSFGKLLML